MSRRLKHVDLCSRCRLDSGWIYPEDGSFYRCDHGVLQQAVEAAERADSDRICPAHEWGFGECRCPQ
jgi:hypothetical protein